MIGAGLLLYRNSATASDPVTLERDRFAAVAEAKLSGDDRAVMQVGQFIVTDREVRERVAAVEANMSYMRG